MATVPPATLAAFGTTAHPVPLAGGSGPAFRVGEVVLKAVEDPAEAAWTQALLASVHSDGFTIPTPVATDRGEWIHNGWAASTFLDDLTPLAPDWARVMAAPGRRGRRHGPPGPRPGRRAG